MISPLQVNAVVSSFATPPPCNLRDDRRQRTRFSRSRPKQTRARPRLSSDGRANFLGTARAGKNYQRRREGERYWSGAVHATAGVRSRMRFGGLTTTRRRRWWSRRINPADKPTRINPQTKRRRVIFTKFIDPYIYIYIYYI